MTVQETPSLCPHIRGSAACTWKVLPMGETERESWTQLESTESVGRVADMVAVAARVLGFG